MNATALAATIALALSGCSSIKPLVVASHVSDPSDAGASDITIDFVGAGATAQFGGVSIDAAIGRKAVNCDYFGSCPSSLGAFGTIRWSPR